MRTTIHSWWPLHPADGATTGGGAGIINCGHGYISDIQCPRSISISVLSVFIHVSSYHLSQIPVYPAQVRFSSIHWFLHSFQAPLLLLRPVCVVTGVRIVYLLLLSNRLDVCLFGTGDLSINSFIQL